MEVEPAVNNNNNNNDATTATDNNNDAATTLTLPPPPLAPVLHSNATEKRLYWDRSHYQSPADQMKALAQSSCLYVGNLAFTTRSHHIRSHFSRLGGSAAVVRRVILGLDRGKKTPCGFCFVEYYERSVALRAVAVLSGTKLDGNVIRVELDAGFQQGREFGRGVGGGQVRDDRRRKQTAPGASEPSRKRGRESEGTRSGGTNSAAATSVSLDAALPSSRETTTGHYGPSTAIHECIPPVVGVAAKQEGEAEDVEMENADAKRVKTEE